MTIDLDSSLFCCGLAVTDPHWPTLEEETNLWRSWHDAQDERAYDTLVQMNLPCVGIFARKYLVYGIPLAQLAVEGKSGIAHAVTMFEPHRAIRFATYAAYWARLFVLSYVIGSWKSVAASPRVSQSTLFRLRRERIRILNLLRKDGFAEIVLASEPMPRVLQLE